MNKFKKAAVFAAGIMISFTLFTTTASAADYTVRKNDSLYKVGVLFKTPVNALKENNNLTSDVIEPGQILDVPAKIYTVKSGDTYYKIAKKYNITVANLKRANNKKSNQLLIGKKLLLPGIWPDTAPLKTMASSNAVVPYSQAEFDLLARLISAEAQGEPYEAMVAVGAVVINRVQSPEWPSTISSVINHVTGGYYQFTPVKNGFIQNPATDTAIKAAKDALNGSDPTNGAMFYFDESTTNTWLWSKTIAARIGHMVYVY
jgi:LysM repeat protein